MNFTIISLHRLHECVIRKVQANQEGFKLISMHWLLVYANDVNILDGSTNTIKKCTEVLVVNIGIDVNADYIVMSKDQHVGQNHNTKESNKSFERV